ncbi:MAG TPA: hotdog domain-containing protein [Flavobacterium sp.]|nr:hotdog domain-containing protein [Flavobacterium sp.]
MELIATKVCKKGDIGVHDNLFGGIMLCWIDEAAGSMATAICHTPNMVTLKMHEVLFKEPVKVNNQIKIYGRVDSIGRSSITLFIEARRFSVYTHDEITVCSTKIVFVRIDDDGRPIPISKSKTEKIKAAIEANKAPSIQ